MSRNTGPKGSSEIVKETSSAIVTGPLRQEHVSGPVNLPKMVTKPGLKTTRNGYIGVKGKVYSVEEHLENVSKPARLCALHLKTELDMVTDYVEDSLGRSSSDNSMMAKQAIKNVRKFTAIIEPLVPRFDVKVGKYVPSTCEKCNEAAIFKLVKGQWIQDWFNETDQVVLERRE